MQAFFRVHAFYYVWKRTNNPNFPSYLGAHSLDVGPYIQINIKQDYLINYSYEQIDI